MIIYIIIHNRAATTYFIELWLLIKKMDYKEVGF